MSSDFECNLCGGTEFVDFRGRLQAMCAKCHSLERTRILKLTLDGLLHQGMRVLHLAPEPALARHIKALVSAGYEPRDYQPQNFPKDLSVQKIDLVEDCEKLPSNSYDLIIHVHVLEHIPCNYAAVLFHLHRSLKPNGRQVFGVPIYRGSYACHLGPLTEAERAKQFGQSDHVRRFGSADLRHTLGMVFNLSPPDLSARFGKDLLNKHRIPESAWSGISSNTIFSVSKDDLRLKL